MVNFLKPKQITWLNFDTSKFGVPINSENLPSPTSSPSQYCLRHYNWTEMAEPWEELFIASSVKFSDIHILPLPASRYEQQKSFQRMEIRQSVSFAWSQANPAKDVAPWSAGRSRPSTSRGSGMSIAIICAIRKLNLRSWSPEGYWSGRKREAILYLIKQSFKQLDAG